MENLRPTAVSALSRLLRHSPAFVQLVVDRFGVRFLVSGLGDASAKVQQPILNILNLAVGELNARSRALLSEEGSLVPALSAILEKAPSVVRAKVRAHPPTPKPARSSGAAASRTKLCASRRRDASSQGILGLAMVVERYCQFIFSRSLRAM